MIEQRAHLCTTKEFETQLPWLLAGKNPVDSVQRQSLSLPLLLVTNSKMLCALCSLLNSDNELYSTHLRVLTQLPKT